MAEPTIGVALTEAALVSDSAYHCTATALIERAVNHCLVLVFIVDPDPIEDEELQIDGLLHDLASASWRGVDARLVIGGSRENRNILDSCLLARARANNIGAPARLLAATEQRSVHSKILIADDRVLLGSHNWSPGALGGQRQDSVLLENASLAAYLVSRFERHWANAKTEGFNVPR